MNSKECPKCKNCSPDDAASCRTCGAEFPSPRPITPEDVIIEADRNYDLGRKHAKGEVAELTIEPMKAALEGLLLAASKLRIRVNHHAPNLVKFSEWDELTEAMRTGERVVKSSNK